MSSPELSRDIAVYMKDITKRFPGVVANDRVCFEARVGEIHALLGENGAGKTTLMNILSGFYRADEGEIYIYGEKVRIRSPRDALQLGIGMVHQHFRLVPALTVAENIVLGMKPMWNPVLNIGKVEKEIKELSERYGLKVDPNAKVWQLSMGERQRAEIIKVLYRGAKILILDEPTSVLTPQEVKQLFKTLVKLKEEGKTIIFITHKLQEVMEISDRVTVLRDGRVVGTVKTLETDVRKLARMMVGREVFLKLEKKPVQKGGVVLEVINLHALNDKGLPALKGVSFTVRKGEIFGIAGVAGNGQKELAEVITGLRKAVEGKVLINGRDITNKPPIAVINEGVAYIPDDRLGLALAPDLGVSENMIMKSYRSREISSKLFLREDIIKRVTAKLVKDYGIITPSLSTPLKFLSGGNQQRLVLAREISLAPSLLIAFDPTRGLDVAATEFIRKKLIEERERSAILLISEDLEEVMSLSDMIAVMYEGEIMGIVPAEKADLEEIGLMMAGQLRKGVAAG